MFPFFAVHKGVIWKCPSVKLCLKIYINISTKYINLTPVVIRCPSLKLCLNWWIFCTFKNFFFAALTQNISIWDQLLSGSVLLFKMVDVIDGQILGFRAYFLVVNMGTIVWFLVLFLSLFSFPVTNLGFGSRGSEFWFWAREILIWWQCVVWLNYRITVSTITFLLSP